jgi:hypothetical protein
MLETVSKKKAKWIKDGDADATEKAKETINKIEEDADFIKKK